MSNVVEAWRPIPGWSNYEVSDRGRVRSLGGWRRGRGGIHSKQRWVPGRVLKAQLASGRLVVTLCDPERPQTTYGVAYLVLWVFVRPPEPGEWALHDHNPDPTNCCLENLRWGTPSENHGDIIRHNGKHCNSKLTPEEVQEVRRLLAEGQVMQKDIAAQFNVSKATITLIKQGKSQKLV